MTLREVRSKLKRLFDEDDEEASGLVNDLKALCYDAVTLRHDPAVNAAFFSAILDETDGLFGFLETAMKKGKEMASICGCVEVIGVVVENMDGKLLKEKLDLLTSLLLKILFVYNSFKKTTEAAAVVTGKLFVAVTVWKKYGIRADEIRAADFVSVVGRLLDVGGKRTNDQKRTLFMLGGCLARYYPAEFQSLTVKFNRTLMAELKLQTESDIQSSVYTVLEACIGALDGILFHYSQDVDLPSAYAALRVVTSAAAASAKQHGGIGFARFGPTRAALRLFAVHSRLFSTFIYNEYRKLYGDFSFWTTKEEAELRKAGLNAVDALLSEVTFQLVENEIKTNRATANIVYSFFANHLEESLIRSASVRDLSQAAKNFSYFSKACAKLETGSKSVEMLILVAERGDAIFLSGEDSIENKLLYLPLLLESLARMIANTDSDSSGAIPDRVWTAAQSLQVVYFHHFPMLDYKYHFRARLVTYQLILAALPHQPTFLNRVVKESLLKIFSTPTTSSMKTDSTSESVDYSTELSRVSVADYLALWKLLVNAEDLKEVDFLGYTKDDIRCVAKMFVGATFASTMGFIGNLDFTYQETEFSEGGETATSPNKRSDLLLFHNIVQFISKLMNHVSFPDFADLVGDICGSLMEQAMRYDMVGGFYTIIGSVLTVANKSQYFDFDETVPTTQHDMFNERRKLKKNLSAFTEQVVDRLSGFKDDLFVNAISFLVSLPMSIVVEKVDKLSKALEMGLTIGSSYLPLAEQCLSAFESWTDQLRSSAALQSLCTVVLPTFDVFLATEQTEEDDSPTHGSDSVSSKKTKAKRSARRQRWSVDEEATDGDDCLKRIRRKMALVLGRLGGQLNKCIITDDTVKLASNCIKWDPSSRLQFQVPFPDLKPTILLDDFLPTVCELAVNSGNRKSKTAACELLHSVVIFIVGQQATSPVGNKEDITRLVRRVLPYLLRLSCDADEIPRQLFQTLMVQLIHWFTGVASTAVQHEAPETATLLDGLMDGLTEKNAAVREYAAFCLNEYLSWSMRQRQRQETRSRVSSLLKRLYQFARHPSAEKRLGAATVFNAIYRTFREDEHLVDEHIFEMLAECLASLAMADRDAASCGTTQLLGRVIDSLKRIILGGATVDDASVYLQRLSSANPAADAPGRRRLPDGWQSATLEGLRRRLWTAGVAEPEEAYRHKCWELLDHPCWSLLGASEEYTLTGHWKGVLESGGVDAAVALMEAACVDPTVGERGVEWLNGLYAAVDCYFMAVMDGFERVEDLWASPKSVFVESINLFVNDISCAPEGLVDDGLFGGSEVVTRLKKKRSCITVRLLEIARMRYQSNTEATAFDKCLLSVEFIQLLVNCCFDPSLVGFDIGDSKVLASLPVAVRGTLSSLKKSTWFQEADAGGHIDRYLHSRFPFPDVSQTLGDDVEGGVECSSATSMLNGYTMLRELHLVDANQVSGVPSDEQLWSSAVTALFRPTAAVDGRRRLRHLTPSQTALVNAAARFALAPPADDSESSSPDVPAALLDATRVAVVGGGGGGSSSSTVGRVVTHALSTPLTQHLAAQPGRLLDQLLVYTTCRTPVEGTGDEDGGKRNVYACLMILLEEFVETPTLRKARGKYVQKAFVDKWESLITPWISSRKTDLKLMVVKLLLKLAVIETDLTLSEQLKNYLNGFHSKASKIFMHLIKDRTLCLSDKNEVLKFASLGLGDTGSARDALMCLVADLPHSVDVDASSLLMAQYTTTLRRLLFALGCTDSPIVLETVLMIVCRDDVHFADQRVALWLARYAKR